MFTGQAITRALLDGVWAMLEEGVNTSIISETHHMGWKRLKTALRQDDEARLTRLMDTRQRQGGAKGGHKNTGKTHRSKPPHTPAYWGQDQTLNARHQAELEAARAKVIERCPVRRMEGFTAAELAALQAKIARYVAQGIGQPAPVLARSPWEALGA